MSNLILIRHGESTWNAANRFTGWVDVPLSDEGRREAERCGKGLHDAGFRADRAYTSTLVRAVDTGRVVLDALGQPELEQVQAWELNERFYGTLTGRDKSQVKAEVGADQVHQWRRGYATPPPGGESLAHTANRAVPYFAEVIVPATREVEVVLVSAHGNSLRAIVKELDGLDDEAVTELDIPTGVPLVYQMADGAPTGKRILEA